MASLYVVPAAVLETFPLHHRGPEALASVSAYEALTLPDTPGMRLLCVERWLDATARRDFEGLPGVRPLTPDQLDAPAPAALLSGAATLGAKTGQTARQALAAIRTHWPSEHLW